MARGKPLTVVLYYRGRAEETVRQQIINSYFKDGFLDLTYKEDIA